MAEMTPQESALFDRLRTSMQDPYIDRMMHKASEYEVMVNETNATSEERAEIVAALDSDWIYRNQQLVVTGDIWMVTPENHRPQKVHVVDMQVVSNGFMFDPDRLEFEGEIMDGLQRASHALIIHTNHPEGLPNYAAMHLTDVQHIDYPFPSPELRYQRFRYHFEAQADEIDDAYLQAKTDTEMLHLLRDFHFDANMADPDDVQALMDGQEYLNQILDVDKQMPYVMTMMGTLAVFTSEEIPKTNQTVTVGAQMAVVTKPIKRLVTISRVLLQPSDLADISAGGSHRFAPYIEGYADGSKRSEPRQRLLIPFSSILWAENVRDLL